MWIARSRNPAGAAALSVTIAATSVFMINPPVVLPAATTPKTAPSECRGTRSTTSAERLMSHASAAATIAPADAALIRRGAVEVAGHQTVDIHLVVPAAGHYELRCTHPLHSSFGMHGAIDVG